LRKKKCTSLGIFRNSQLIFAELWLKIIRLETAEQAQSPPSPATIFSLYYNGKFVTSDMGVCLDNRFDKTVRV